MFVGSAVALREDQLPLRALPRLCLRGFTLRLKKRPLLACSQVSKDCIAG